MAKSPDYKARPGFSIRLADPESLKPYDKNPRLISQAAIDKVLASVREFGWRQPIVVDESGVILVGHARRLAALKGGYKAVPVHDAIGLSDAQKKAYRLADNRTGEESQWDLPVLSAEIAALRLEGFDLGPLGFDLAELRGLEAKEPGKDPEATPEPPKKPVTKAGDLWELGDHYLLCGDSCSANDVDRVLCGERADLTLTDPPYGVDLNYVDFKDSKAAVAALADKWLPIAQAVSATVVFSPGVTRQWLYPEPNWVLCWFYGGGQLRSPWGFNCWQPFLCYGKDPSLGKGHGARPDAVSMNTPANAANLDHPCPKPIKLWEWLFDRLSFNHGELIFEPFAGSGTTIIVAEMKSRRCAGIEISPSYCDVIVRRWEEFTGKKAKLAESGDSFEQTAKRRKVSLKKEASAAT